MKRNAAGGVAVPEPGGYQRGNPVMGAGIFSIVPGHRSWWVECGSCGGAGKVKSGKRGTRVCSMCWGNGEHNKNGARKKR